MPTIVSLPPGVLMCLTQILTSKVKAYGVDPLTSILVGCNFSFSYAMWCNLPFLDHVMGTCQILDICYLTIHLINLEICTIKHIVLLPAGTSQSESVVYLSIYNYMTCSESQRVCVQGTENDSSTTLFICLFLMCLLPPALLQEYLCTQKFMVVHWYIQ